MGHRHAGLVADDQCLSIHGGDRYLTLVFAGRQIGVQHDLALMSVVYRDTFNWDDRLEVDYVRLTDPQGIKTGRIGCYTRLGHRSGLAFPKPNLNSWLGRMPGSEQ